MAGKEPKQLCLWPDSELRRYAASRALTALADEYVTSMQSLQGKSPIPRELDEIAFACLVLCLEHGFVLSPVALNVLTKCREAAANGSHTAWLNELPFRLAQQSLRADWIDDAVYELTESLSEGQSGIRGYMIKLAWLCRRHLSAHEAAPHLFQNIAGTLAYVDISVGLCFTLFGSRSAFWEAANAYKPTKIFAEQYADRLEHVRSTGPEAFCSSLWEFEATIRRRVETAIATSAGVTRSTQGAKV